MVMKILRHNRLLRIDFHGEGYDEPYAVEWNQRMNKDGHSIGGRNYGTYKTYRKALSVYRELSRANGIKVE